MPMTLEQLREEVLALPSDQREQFIASLSDEREDLSPEFHPAWPAELRFRAEEYKAGRMGGISFEEWEKELDEPIG